MKQLRPRKYDWFGYGVWFFYGAVVGGLPLFVLHFALHTLNTGTWQIVGLLAVCCLAGGLWWGRKHRRRWQDENAAGEIADEILGNRR